jgi:DNA-binding transcriptional MerR regulator
LSFAHSTGQKRLYSLEDIAFLRKVRDLSRQGLPLSKIEETLKAEVVQADPGETALMTLSDITQALAMAREAYSSLELKNTELQERVSTLEEYIHTPWWRRKKAPKTRF